MNTLSPDATMSFVLSGDYSSNGGYDGGGINPVIGKNGERLFDIISQPGGLSTDFGGTADSNYSKTVSGSKGWLLLSVLAVLVIFVFSRRRRSL